MENTNNPQMGGDGQSLKSSAGMSPVVKGLVGIIVLAGVGYGGWYLGQNQKSNVKSQNVNSKLKNVETPTTPVVTPTPTTPVPPTTTPDPTADLSSKDSSTEGWKTYENKDYGFSFKYPGDWSIEKDALPKIGTKESDTRVSDSLIIKSKDGQSTTVWVNPGGFGLEGNSDFYTCSIVNEKIVVSKKQNEPESITGGVSCSSLELNSNTYFVASSFNLNQRTASLSVFDQILSTFRFTK